MGMDAGFHDAVLAATSHLPHLLSFALYDILNERFASTTLERFSAGGLRDFTRIAASNATMWADIFDVNRDAVLDALDTMQKRLAHPVPHRD